MGRKKRQQDNYWDSEEFQQDQAAVEQAVEAEEEVVVEEETAGKGKNKKKNQQKQKGKKGKQVVVEEEEEPEPEPEPEPEYEAEPEAEEVEQVEETPATTAGKKKKKKKKKKSKGGALAEEEVAEETEPQEEVVAEEAAPAEEVEETPVEEKPAVETAEKTSSKKKKKKGKGADTAVEEEDDKASAKGKKKKKGGIGNKLAQFILEQRAEEERRRLEEEARIKAEEEEEERLREEEERQAAIAEAKKAKKKQKEKKKQQENAVKAEEKKRAEALQRLQGMQGVILPNLDADKAKRPVYDNKKKKKPQQKAGGASPEVASATSEVPKPAETPKAAPAPVEEEFIEVEEEIEEEIEEEVDDEEPEKESGKAEENGDLDDWESADVDQLLDKKEDSWEATTVAKKPKKVVKKVVKKVIKKLVPKPKSTSSTAQTTVASQPSPSIQPSSEPKESIIPPGENMRSPICCVLGHVDAGKTKILDKIRSTNVQGGEAGGITQQIGATYLPIDVIRGQTEQLNKNGRLSYKVPGLLIIDTPGHESFTNLRSRGSSLCDIAILVVDFHSLLQPQTKESLSLLKQRKTPFVVALNKVDRLYDWKSTPNSPIQASLKKQKKDTVVEYEQRIKDAIVEFANEGLNASLYYKNSDFKSVVSIVPCSAKTGEGIPDLLMLLVQLTQKMMSKQLLLLSDLKCTILEVKVVDGFGTTIDVILSNGELHQGDTILVCGRNGPIVTTIRSLLTPQPCSEMRVTKSGYIHHKAVKAAQGIKIVAADLELAVAGTSLMVAKPGDDIQKLQDEVQEDLKKFTQMADKSGKGVYVQASTLGSLEALLAFLKDSKVPVSAVNIGPVHLKDVKRAAVMLEHDKQFAVMLCFDVKVDSDAEELADELGVKIFTADVIYHLTDQFQKYLDTLKAEKQKAAAEEAVFPAIIKILKEHVYNTRDPIIVGVEVVEGLLRVGTPLVAALEGGKKLDLGKCASIEHNKKNVDKAGKGMEVCIKIDPSNLSQKPLLGRQFEVEHPIYSKITRKSLDALKDNFAEELTKNNKELLQVAVKLKKAFGVD